jgi:hypothetical protein
MSGDINDYRRSQAPKEDQEAFGWTIVRAKPGKELKLMVLSDDLLGMETHFAFERTGPCRLHDCDSCNKGQVSRWKGYLLALNTANDQKIILEFTPPAYYPLADAKRKYGTLRGCLISVGRAKATFNGKVQIIVKDIKVIPPGRFEVYGIWDILSRIWKLKQSVQPRVARPDDDRDLYPSEAA